ncbi:MAG TPA: OmpA family protein [Niabella sp.]|nr:OmpA family protein [Niabella sp.]HOZ95671.1 OmpA family protein [Niabella sp.]HQW13911.1 OmpA family protein [Niabella sp.]HQX19196.1 OmpA family protein [Niabella sp.]HQX41334.1 OmpA family protein [Niabella sp.]
MSVFKTTVFATAIAALTLTSCDSMNRTQKGAAIGVGGGAAVGAVIGKATGNTALGAIIGAAVGGTAGAIIGKKMDKQAEEIKNEVPGAKVERVDEGIVVEFSSAVLFGFDQSNLTAKSQSTLDDLIIILNKYPDTDVEIQGHTDNTGTAKYNLSLSERRASVVSNYLSDHGIGLQRLTTKGYGLNNPKYSNDTPDGRSQNRRVEFLITANDKMKQDAAKEAGTN